MDARPEPVLREPAERVDPRARWLWGAAVLLPSLVLLAVAAVAEAAVQRLDLPWWVWVVLGAGVLAQAVLVAQWRCAVHRWEVTGSAVHTQTGWWARERRIAPMSRIQTVDYAQGAFARLLGLASVTVTTASAAGALEIAGLDSERARRLAAELTRMADAVEGDAT